MTEADILKWIVTAILGIAVWFFKRTLDNLDGKVAGVDKDLQEHKKTQAVEMQTVRQNYLHRDDFREFKVELRTMFEEIKQELREVKQKNV